MSSNIAVGTILIEDRPLITRSLNLSSQPYMGAWGVLTTTDLELRIREAGWQFFFMAAAVNARVYGSVSPNSIKRALKQIFAKVRRQDFNCLQVVGIRQGRFLGVPYTNVCVHSRHIQQGFLLQTDEERNRAKMTLQLVA
jgi:hypothetical protein